MERKRFLTTLGLVPFAITLPSIIFKMTEPDLFYFKDDGKIPNSKLPLLLYHNTIPKDEQDPNRWLIEQFAKEQWTNAWTNGIYSYHHYHSTSHEVLGIFSGTAVLHLGGEKGDIVEVVKGDIIIIPAGVGHKKIKGQNLGVVGAYPDGRDWDLLLGKPGERPQADENIMGLPVPKTDPWLGRQQGLTKFWN